ncbi:Glu-tRNA(Gln) amidotransferase subunit GatD [Staphylothermus hellenicus]|uniref:Glutamyl-tRNA(Gln) amidotransferase subunit D n=1 Tax=Staphylothermus hellenicus (strain DSM 12710 / JCM 10830 / BK20S6-10-b1 / P8) TaxID=591019 RepID=D7D949_STAHD|nr:Glu-tRNA(Gln) amidotransferase subunit GatD [Staphylothermus hellenicus]ADI32295.1 glutamyl-tRNA(Gln) amidotransferase, subunit D [Staphylothermus hellenicus DSM 12710]
MYADEYLGYKGYIARILREIGAEVGDKIRISTEKRIFEGILMPREALYGEKPFIIIKLDNGYNIGIRISGKEKIEVLEKREKRTVKTQVFRKQKKDLPRIVLLSTGGTIVSKVDYETGAVKPALSVEELLEWIPEISNTAFIDAKEILNVFSEDITPKHWEKISSEIYREMKNGVDGIVVAHGTDMMAYTAAAIAFAIKNKPVPIVFVGAQRSSDRPSTDSAFNLKAAFLTAAKAPFAESVVVMHGETGDTYALAHRGVKVRKMHTSRRDAFQSINDYPLAIIYPEKNKIEIINKIVELRDKSKDPILENKFDDKVVMIKAYPGFQPEIIDLLVDKGFHGIVIEGSGLGHISNRVIDSIKRAVEEGIPVVMTSQCLFGRVNMHVYSTGRKLLSVGVIPGSDMLPETAYVKLSWILGSKTRDLREVYRLMTTNIVGEINPRLTINLYPRWPI